MIDLLSERKINIYVFAFFMAYVYFLYANTFGNSWTHDDFPVVVRNLDIRSLKTFLENSYPGRPLREISYFIDYSIFGLEPSGYYIQHLFWHGINTFLIFVLVQRLGGKKLVAWTAALFFLVHPIQVESVANISNRKEILCLAFCLLSFITYTNIFESRRWLLGFTLSLTFGFLAFSAKEIAVVLPLLFIAYEFAFVPKGERLLAKRPQLLISTITLLISAFLVWYFFGGGREVFLQESLWRLRRFDYRLGASSEPLHFLMYFKSCGFMFSKFIFPVGLAAEYSYAIPRGLSDPWVLSTSLGFVFYILAICYSYKRQPIIFIALVWLVVFWLPVSNLWPLGYFAADRYLYAPSVGFAVAFSSLIYILLRQSVLLLGFILALVISFSIITWQQTQVWESSKALWTHTVKVSPHSSHALGFLGVIYMDEGNMERAFEFHSRAIKENPSNPAANYDLGRIYERRSDRDAALFHYLKFIKTNDQRYTEEVDKVKKHLSRYYGVTEKSRND